MTTYGYHVTSDTNLASIMTKGLIPAIGERSLDIREPDPAVYLFNTLEDVENGLDFWLRGYFGGEILHVLKVDLTEVDVTQKFDWEFRCFDRIPADVIEYLQIA